MRSCYYLVLLLLATATALDDYCYLHFAPAVSAVTTATAPAFATRDMRMPFVIVLLSPVWQLIAGDDRAPRTSARMSLPSIQNLGVAVPAGPR